MKWEEAAELWLKGRASNKWYKKDAGYVERLTDYLGGLELAEIDKLTLQRVSANLSANRSAETVNRLMGVARTILLAFEEAVEGWTAPRVKKQKVIERVRFLTSEEATGLLEALPSRIRPLAAFALMTGLRSFNIRHLEWSEVSIDRRWGSIPGDKMKNGHPFGFPLNDGAIDVLKAQRGLHPRWVFPIKYRGELVPMQNVDTRMWERACTKAGIGDFHFHDLRHTFASWHVQNGTNEAALQELGSWRDPKSMRRYTHLAGSHLSAAAGNIEKLVCLPSSPPKPSRNGSISASSRRGKSCEPCPSSRLAKEASA